jgi:methylglutaconyl-CoA hydratase
MANATGNGTVLWDLDARAVATVRLNRPQVNNAYNGDLVQGVHQAMDALGMQQDLRVLVLRGNGKHFQAGADLAWIGAVGQASPEENERVSRATAELVRRLDTLPVPTLALVQGGCFGGGTGIVAACDIVIAADNAVFAITETRWGLMAGIILPQLCQAIGLRALRRYALAGERFDAREAHRIGLVHDVCALAELEAVGAKIVDSLLLTAPHATTATKLRALQVAGAFVDDGVFRDLVREHAAIRQLPEALEGLASFHEKRKPAWYREMSRPDAE